MKFFSVDNGSGIQLDGWQMRPPDFDREKEYPALFFVYGEPAGTTVKDSWGGSRYLWHLMLTQKGYLVVSIDNQGTPAPKGREWRKCIYGQIGILASADQAGAVRTLGALDYVDASRIGIWGWSGGGSMREGTRPFTFTPSLPGTCSNTCRRVRSRIDGGEV